jgi:hypothetical protein
VEVRQRAHHDNFDLGTEKGGILKTRTGQGRPSLGRSRVPTYAFFLAFSDSPTIVKPATIIAERLLD